MRTPLLFVSFLVLVAPSRAGAAEPADEADELVRSIDREAQALTTDDCISACKALASMRRATERLCAIDPGTRCTDARTKLGTATAKVRSACPACAIETQRPTPDVETRESVGTASEPPRERARGGCAGCSTTGATSDVAPWMALGALAALFRRRKPRR